METDLNRTHRLTLAGADGGRRSALRVGVGGARFPHSGSFLALLPPPPPGPMASGLGGSVAGEPVSLPALPSSPFHRVPPPSCKEEGAGGRGSQSRQRQRGEAAVTAAGRGREERGGLALAPCLALLCLRLCAHLLPKPPASAPGPPAGPQSIPDSAPAQTACNAARGRRVSALSWPPGAPSHGPGGTGRGRRGPCGAKAERRVCPIPGTWTDPMTSSQVSQGLKGRGRECRFHPPRPLSLSDPGQALTHTLPYSQAPSRLFRAAGHRGSKPWVPWGAGETGGQVGRGSRCGRV